MANDFDSDRMPHSVVEAAQQCFQQAYASQMKGDLAEAIRLYRKSIKLHPTAEAHTYLGWTYSFRGELEAAIEECKTAISIDPAFGNPYNDIGAYLIRMGNFEEAIPWLEIAVTAERYDARYFPHFNLGRVYERLGEFLLALEEYHHAAEIDASYKPALQAVERLHAWMN